MASITLNFRIKVAWWWKWYAFGVVVVARLMGTEPDLDKLEDWAQRAITVTVLHDEDKG
jgi:hypothetical protein